MLAMSTSEYLNRFRSEFTKIQFNYHDVESQKPNMTIKSGSKRCQKANLNSDLK